MDYYWRGKGLTPMEAFQAQVYSDMAGYFLVLGLHGLSLRSYHKTLAYIFSNPSFYTGRAYVYLHLGKYYLAIEDCDTALRLNPNYTPAMEVSWCAYACLEFLPMLFRMTYNSYFRAFRPYRPKRFYPGKYCDNDLDCEQHRFPEINAEQMLTDEKVELGDFYVNHALIALKCNKNKLGVFLATEAAKYNPLHIAAYYVMALCHVSLNNFEQAINAFYKVEVLEHRKKFNEPVCIFAKTQIFMEVAGITNYQKTNLLKFFAVHDIKFQLENTYLTKTSSEYMYLGNRDMDRADYYGAILWYTKAITRNPSWPGYRTARARAYIKVYKYGEALLDCRDALRLNFRCSEAFDALGVISLCRGDFSEACRLFVCAKKCAKHKKPQGSRLPEAKERYRWQLFNLEPVESIDVQMWIDRMRREIKLRPEPCKDADRLGTNWTDAASYHMRY